MNRSMRLRFSILLSMAIIAAFSLFLLTAGMVKANSVTITDQSGVLDAGRVRTEAAKLPDTIVIFTTKTFNGDQNALDSTTRSGLPDQNSIAIGIDTVQRHLSIESGSKVKLSNSQADDAVSAFKDKYNGGDYTGATIAAIDSLNSSLSGGSKTPAGVIIAAVLIVFGALVALFSFARRRTRGGPPRGGRRWPGFGPYYGGFYGGSHSSGSSSGGSYGGGAGGSFGGGSAGGGGSSF